MTKADGSADRTDRRAPRDGLSRVIGDAEPPLSNATIGQFLDAAVARFADRSAVVFREQGVRRSWREFQSDVDRTAAGLLALGLAKGDRVGIWSPNRLRMDAHPVRHRAGRA